jgi:ribonuclease HI
LNSEWDKKFYFLHMKSGEVGTTLKHRGGRCGGVVFDSEGKKNIEFSWGIGHTTNNLAEALAVYLGMHLIP